MPYSLTRINRNIDAYLNDKPLEKRPGFKPGGVVEPGVTHYAKKGYRLLEPEFEERIREKITLKPGQKWRFDLHTYGVPKGDPLYNKARYYGDKREKDIIRQAEYAKDPEKVKRKKETQKKRYELHKDEILAKDRAHKAKPEVAKRRKIIAEIYAASPHGKAVREAAVTKRMAEVGIFPSGSNYNEKVWRDLWRSSQKKGQERFIWVDENGNQLFKKDYPKKDGKVNWTSDYKKIKFYDKETKQFIKLDSSIKGKGISLKKYLNQKSVGGSGAYEGAIETYKNKDVYKSHKIMYQGKKQNLGTILRDKLFSPMDKKKAQFGKSAFHVAHPDLMNQWWKSEVAFVDANLNLEKLDKRLVSDMKLAKDTAAKNKVLINYAKKVEAQPGGITRIIDDITYGVKPTEYSVIKEAGKEAGLMKSKNFRTLVENIGCPGKAAGGRVGFQAGADCYARGLEKIRTNDITTAVEKENFKKLTQLARPHLKAYINTLPESIVKRVGADAFFTKAKGGGRRIPGLNLLIAGLFGYDMSKMLEEGESWGDIGKEAASWGTFGIIPGKVHAQEKEFLEHVDKLPSSDFTKQILETRKDFYDDPRYFDSQTWFGVRGNIGREGVEALNERRAVLKTLEEEHPNWQLYNPFLNFAKERYLQRKKREHWKGEPAAYGYTDPSTGELYSFFSPHETAEEALGKKRKWIHQDTAEKIEGGIEPLLTKLFGSKYYGGDKHASASGYSGGGITTLDPLKPWALPPEAGPDPRGQKIKEGIVSVIK
jgi:hypothetical protein